MFNIMHQKHLVHHKTIKKDVQSMWSISFIMFQILCQHAWLCSMILGGAVGDYFLHIVVCTNTSVGDYLLYICYCFYKYILQCGCNYGERESGSRKSTLPWLQTQPMTSDYNSSARICSYYSCTWKKEIFFCQIFFVKKETNIYSLSSTKCFQILWFWGHISRLQSHEIGWGRHFTVYEKQ